jgi:hypothetical protein
MLVIELLCRVLDSYVLRGAVRALGVVFVSRSRAVPSIVRSCAVCAADLALTVSCDMLIHLAFEALLEIGRLVVDGAWVLGAVDDQAPFDREIGNPFVVEDDD